MENVSLRCHAHNAFEADRDFGTSFMAGKRARKVREEPLKVREPVARYVVRGLPYAHDAMARPHSADLREPNSMGS